MSGYDCRHKCVTFRQDTVNDDADVMSSGRLFRSYGLAEANDLLPIVTRRDGRTVSWLEGIDSETACQQQPIRQVPRRRAMKSSANTDRQFKFDSVSAPLQCESL